MFYKLLILSTLLIISHAEIQTVTLTSISNVTTDLILKDDYNLNNLNYLNNRIIDQLIEINLIIVN